MTGRVVSGKHRDEDAAIETSLRPRRLADYIGQDKVKDTLSIFIEAALARGEP
ncbi:MAG TPA: Holliday junction branch migration DNA helicase RuvB, partial [Chloroflexi bacterium]|nr:Holliday junction branch migration DNA helicase RuvB [Chloroflexota bacterium]